ncbi:hypothetical protein [Actinacidiphila yeochonensis]|uniref:hypothetical protein n=1 Tax=Actinacidiphila yeochonensis TaxID=89050 RepID=UPI0012FF56BE|nr:hypothetical protein [Actinacidiphila yeochonensis]
MNALSNQGPAPIGSGRAASRSERALRLRLSAVCVPVFLVLSGLLAWGASETKPGDTQTVVAVLSAACFAAAVAALITAVRTSVGLRREERRRSSP